MKPMSIIILINNWILIYFRNYKKNKSESIKIFLIILLIISNISEKSDYFYTNYNNDYQLFERELNKYNYNNKFDLSFEQLNKTYKSQKFAIIRRLGCPNCGFFSFYIVNLGCIMKYLSKGFIPIIDLQSFKNVYNNGNTSLNNPWELFFYQPYNYTLNEVKKYGKNIQYFECNSKYRPSEINIYYQNKTINFWYNIANKYMPIKNEIILESKLIMKNLFNNSNNILGVKIRGTDYLSVKPKKHSKQPRVEQVISDVKYMDRIHKYDFIFFATEDEIIKHKFIPHFKEKLKLLNPNVIVSYDYSNKYKINMNENIKGNLDYIKNYLLNIIILSKCLDIITSRCSGAAGIFILSKGFRNIKVYDLGLY